MMCIKASIRAQGFHFLMFAFMHIKGSARYACELCLCLRRREDQAELNGERKLHCCSITFTLSYITRYIRQLYIELQFRLHSSLIL